MQIGDISSNSSSTIVELFERLQIFSTKIYIFIEKIFINLLNINPSEAKEVVVRKLAHITEFTLLSFCINQFFTKNILKIQFKKILLSVNITFIIAFIDETIQLFIPNRAGQIQDVLIDSFGIFIGCLLFLFICLFTKLLITNRRKRHGN